MNHIPEPMRALLAALAEALNAPLAADLADDATRYRILRHRAENAEIAIGSVLKHGMEDLEGSTRWLREATAAEPVTYTVWQQPAGQGEKDTHTGESTPQPVDACGRCKKPFDPTDTRWDGHARHRDTPFCRSCVDRCHESTDAFHRCPICAPAPADTEEVGEQ
jgi:hypothetical protein